MSENILFMFFLFFQVIAITCYKGVCELCFVSLFFLMELFFFCVNR